MTWLRKFLRQFIKNKTKKLFKIKNFTEIFLKYAE